MGYSQLSPCGHLAITDTPIKRTAAKSQEKTNYRRLTEIKSRYYGLSLMRTLTRGPYGVRYKGSWLYMLTNGGLFINSFIWPAWLRSFLRFYRAPLVMGHSNFFRFVHMKNSVQTLEEGAGGWWRLWKGREYQEHRLCIYLGGNGFGQSQPASMVLH